MTKAERLRKLYETKLGKSLVSNLSDAQIKLVSKYYNSLDDTSDIDSKIFQGRNDTELHEMARTLVEEEEESEDIPAGLDDLLGSIKDEEPEPERPESSGALAVYVPDSREEDLVSEEIDERILTLLGLDDVIDLDYATYKSLLKEKMMAGRMSDSEMPSEEVELLTNEFKRVKANTGRFKVKRDKINFDSFMGEVKEKKEEEGPRPTTEILPLPGTAEPKSTPEPEVQEEQKADKIEGIQKFLGGVSERLENIEKNLSDMLDVQAEQARVEKKEVEGDRITGEKQKKRKKENDREGGILGSIGKSIKDKVLAPVKGFFETLLNFFTQIFLGSLVMEIIKIIENPMMIFNPFIAMINGVINMLNSVLTLMFSGIVGGINIFTGLLNGGIGNLENLVNGVFGLFGEVEEGDKFTLPKIPEAKAPQIPNIPYFEPEEPKKEEVTPVQGKSGGGEVEEIKVAGYKEGGQVEEIKVAGYKEGGQVEVTPVQGKSGGGQVEETKVAGYKEGGQVFNLNIGGFKGGTSILKPIVGMAGGGMIAMSNIVNSPVEISNMGFAGGGSVTNTMSPITNLGYTGGGSVTNSSTSPLNVSNFRYEGGGGANITGGNITNNTNVKGFNEGGGVTSNSGQKITGAGPDTQLIAAQPGEIVMSRGAVSKYGAGNLLAMNSAGGGNNTPRMTNNVQMANGGGMIAMNGFADGGSITGSSGQTVTGMGPDTQLIAAQPGEIVMSKKAVQAYGANNLLAMNKDAGGTNIPTMGSVQGFSNGGQVGARMSLSRDAKYDIIIPLDHTRKPGTIPDTPGGNTFKGSNSTGAAGREREAQDPAAKMIAERMADQGMRVRIYSPEDAGDYQTYDRYLRQQAKMGVRIMPLHFDAGIQTDPNKPRYGQVVGTGFLTRTRSGDTDDKRFADPIQAVLAEFQSDNPDLGRIAQDTDDNITVNQGAASPTALVELGIMTFWEEKYGKNFTQHPEFQKFAMRIADAAVVGTGLKPGVTQPSGNMMPSVEPQTPAVPQHSAERKEKIARAQRTLTMINKAMENVQEKRKSNTGSGARVVIPDVGTYVEGTSHGFLPTNKYFAPDGSDLTKEEFDEKVAVARRKLRVSIMDLKSNNTVPGSGMYIPPSAQITAPTTPPSAQITAPTTPPAPILPPPPPPTGQGQVSVLPAPASSGQATPNVASPTAGQKEVPSFSSRDLGNTEFIVIKSIYNIVG